MIEVFIKVNNKNEIIDIQSGIFLDNHTDYIKIDEGYGDKYAHADSQYLEKSLIDDNGNFTYKYSKGKVIEK